MLAGCANGTEPAPTTTGAPAGGLPAATSTTAPAVSEPTAIPATAALPALTPSPSATPAPAATRAPATVAPTPAPTAPAAVVAPASAFSADRAFAHVEALATGIGIRAAGTEGERRGADYLAGQLASFGYKVDRQSFPIAQLRESRAALTVPGPQARDLQPQPLQGSASAEVTAPVVVAGRGGAADFRGVEAAGKIALVERGDLTFGEKARQARSAGAVAAIIYNNVEGQFQGSLGEEMDLPVVALTREDGLWLRQRVEEGAPVEATLQVTISVTRGQSQNVAGVTSAAPADRPIIIVGGHYDSAPAGPGANDNASGTAVMLEMARVLAGDRRAEFRFIGFGAEEMGLVGSRAYVAAMPAAERERVALMVNLDMLAVGDLTLVGGGDELVARALAIARDLGVGEVRAMEGPRAEASDHVSFMAAGIPSVFINRPNDPNYHTARDIPQYVSAEALEIASQISLRLIEEALTG